MGQQILCIVDSGTSLFSTVLINSFWREAVLGLYALEGTEGAHACNARQ